MEKTQLNDKVKFEMIFFLMDKNGNGSIDFNEFLPFARGYFQYKPTQPNYYKYLAFKTLDFNCNHRLDESELKRLLEFWGMQSDKEACKKFREQSGKAPKQGWTVDEFCELFDF